MEVDFAGFGGTRLSGALVLPRAVPDGGCPGLVLLPGSGPTDRNGDPAGGNGSGLLRDVAETLAEAGVASLRFDKRGLFASAAGLPDDRAAWAPFFDWDAFVGDALAARDHLASRPELRGRPVGFLGHSEGGLLALDAQARLPGDAEAPLALCAVPARPFADVVDGQLRRLLAAEGRAPADRRRIRARFATLAADVMRTHAVTPEDVPAELAGLFPDYLGPFLGKLMALDPLALVRRRRGPLLVAHGAADLQVPFADAHRLHAAAEASGADAELAVIPGASHSFDDADPAHGRARRETLDAIARWVGRAFGLPATPPGTPPE